MEENNLLWLDVMIRSLTIFEEAQANFTEDFWQDMSLYMGQHDQVTWSQVSDLKDALIDLKDKAVDIKQLLESAE